LVVLSVKYTKILFFLKAKRERKKGENVIQCLEKHNLIILLQFVDVITKQMDRWKATSTTFFGKFCVWENHVLCFARIVFDIVQIRPPLSCQFWKH
jgi:hypothetical protein